jgi:hypothetical protein
MVWRQHDLTLPSFKRGCHLVTDIVSREVAGSLQGVKVGLAHIFSEWAARRRERGMAHRGWAAPS